MQNQIQTANAVLPERTLTVPLTNSETYHEYTEQIETEMQETEMSIGEYIEFSHLENIEL